MMILVNDTVMAVFLLFFGCACSAVAAISLLNVRNPAYTREPFRQYSEQIKVWVFTWMTLTFILSGLFLLFWLEVAARFSYYLSVTIVGIGLAAFGPRFMRAALQRNNRNGRIPFGPTLAALICALEALCLFMVVAGVGFMLFSIGIVLPDAVGVIILWTMACAGIVFFGGLIVAILLAA